MVLNVVLEEISNKFPYISAVLILLSSCGSKHEDNKLTDGVESSEHRIFVSSIKYPGDLGGLDSADSLCNNLARSSGLELTYRAFLGSSIKSLKERFALTGSVYNFSNIDTDNKSRHKIVEIGNDLFNTDRKNLLGLIQYDELGREEIGPVWTGSDSEGNYSLPIIKSCNNWTSSSSTDDGTVGDNSKDSSFYLENSLYETCNFSLSLYCISVNFL